MWTSSDMNKSRDHDIVHPLSFRKNNDMTTLQHNHPIGSPNPTTGEISEGVYEFYDFLKIDFKSCPACQEKAAQLREQRAEMFRALGYGSLGGDDNRAPIWETLNLETISGIRDNLKGLSQNERVVLYEIAWGMIVAQLKYERQFKARSPKYFWSSFINCLHILTQGLIDS